MAKADTAVTFKATLQRPATPKNATWCFLVLPKAASAKLPTRSMVTVSGTLAEAAFTATLEPDGEGSHWCKVGKALLDKAGVGAGDSVQLQVAPVEKEPEPRVQRIDVAIDKLACGNRRACCFDRSGMYSKGNMGPPAAAAD